MRSRSTLFALALWLCVALGAPSHAQSALGDITTLSVADMTVTIDGVTRATTTTLPFDWDTAFRGHSGQAELTISIPRPTALDLGEPYMLAISSIANAYSISLNGAMLAVAGSLDTPGARWSAKLPVSIHIPATLIGDSNRLVIRLRADAGRRAGIAPLLFGTARALKPVHAQEYRARFLPTLAGTSFALLVAAFCWLLWLQHREPLYAWACVAELLWAITVGDVILETTPLHWPLWRNVLLVTLALWICALYEIAARVFESRPRYERWIIRIAAIALAPCIGLWALTASPLAIEIWRGVSATLVAALAVRLLWSLRTKADFARVLLASGIVTLYVAAAYDAFASKVAATPFNDSFWGEYAGAFLGVTILWIVAQQFRLARHEAAALHASLARRVAEKERDLRDSYAQLSVLERSRAVASERARILRDMHDGVGANLATAMRQLESGRAANSDVAATLRDSLDHLKLSMDAMTFPAGDLNALLASFRYRLQPRIESAGLRVSWRVNELPPWRHEVDRAMNHLQFMLLEAVANVLQHARASELSIGAVVRDDGIHITIADDGLGCSEVDRSKPRNGLRSMRERAVLIGADLVIEPLLPGTRIRIVLPIGASAVVQPPVSRSQRSVPLALPTPIP